jgi:signal transduction histidine kinase
VSLTNRLSLYFLGALALVLVGFSFGLYLMARTYLYRQLDARLEAALDTLAAVAESEPDGLEWEPREHHLVLGQDAGEDQVRWAVRRAEGDMVDRSANYLFGLATPVLPALDAEGGSRPASAGQGWRLLQRTVHANPASAGVRSPDGQPRYTALVITGMVLEGPVETTLRNLALALVGLSGGVWLTAAFLGRGWCRRALAPVTQMAVSARSIKGTDWGQRLPSPKTGDEVQDLGQAFNGLLDRLRESFERQRQFTGNASHQLRTPLAAMLGQVEVCLRRERSGEDYRQTLDLVRGQAQQLRQIIEMLLFLARADAETQLPNLERIDLIEWLPVHLRRWAEHPRAADFRIETPTQKQVCASVQAPLLGQLVDNLLENACKYSRAGSRITLRLECAKSQVLLSVVDEGEGIAAVDLPRLFEPFYRSARAHSQGKSGVGLGLAVAQRIATAFGGALAVTSDLGKGSCFTLTLPAT